jgi:hypothetical protein
MSRLPAALWDLLGRMEEITPGGPLVALPLLAAAWLAARWLERDRAHPSAGLALARLWAGMLALSALLLLVGWAVTRETTSYELPPLWWLGETLLVASLVPPAHALRSTLLGLISRPRRARPGAAYLRAAAWSVFAAVTLVCVHAFGMFLVFPIGGGEFHAMFAYTSDGRVEVAFAAWRASVLILGFAAIAFGFWIPLPWWVASLMAVVVGVVHWWQVCAWTPQSPAFHGAVVGLLVAMPFAVLLISSVGVLLRRAWSPRVLQLTRKNKERSS